MTASKVLVVEGVSDFAYLSALDRHIGDLSAHRRVFVTAAHEIAHRMLPWDGANDTGMTAVFDALDLLGGFGLLAPTDWPTGMAADTTRSATILILEHHGDLASRLASWTTSDFVGMPPGAWFGSGGTGMLTPTINMPQVFFRLSDDTEPFLLNVRAALLRFLDALRAMARLCVRRIRKFGRERSLVLARIVRLPETLAFILIILAVCRHYGHRAEPDDHASPFIRRHLVSMGSCLLA
jgi:hypothetical protein